MAKSKHFGALAAAAGALVAVALLMLMLVLVKPQPAEAAFPGANGTIAYSHWDGHDWEIEIITDELVDGKYRLFRRVTDNERDDLWPNYSPDGMRIVYSHFDGNDWDIYTQTPNAKWPLPNPVPVTDNTVDERRPSYASRDGSRIAYEWWGGNDSEIYTLDAATGLSPVQHTNNTTNDLSPSYGHNEIAYEGWDGNDWEIYTLDATGGTPRRVTDNSWEDRSPDYLPFGGRIYYASWDGNDWEINRVHRPRFGRTYLPVPVTHNTTNDYTPASSPNRQLFVYSSSDGNDFEIYMRDYSGGSPVQVTRNSTDDFDPSWRPHPGPLRFAKSSTRRATR